MSAASRERSRGGLPALAMTPLFVALPILVYFALASDRTTGNEPVDDGSCPTGTHVREHSVYLVDLRKPLDALQRAVPGRLLVEVTNALPAGTALEVFALSAYAEAPRTLIGRLCKTFDNDELIVETAKDYDGGAADCADLPAQMAAPLRASAARFCRQRDALRGRIDALASAPASPAASANLIEAFEDTGANFATDAERSLYVFSDMLQHAPWFSHLDLPAEQWDFAGLAERRRSMPLAEPLRGVGEGTRVHVFYVPRHATTTAPERQQTHQRFWRDYFATADVVFDDQPAMARYAAAPQMNLPTETELASYEREQLRHSNQLNEQLRSELQASRRTLERERQALAAAQRRLAEDQRRLAEETARREAAEGTRASGPQTSTADAVAARTES